MLNYVLDVKRSYVFLPLRYAFVMDPIDLLQQERKVRYHCV